MQHISLFIATASGSEHIEAPPLAYKKWNLQDQEAVSNHVSCGKFINCLFLPTWPLYIHNIHSF